MEGQIQRVRTAQTIVAMVCVALVALIGRLTYIQAEMRPELRRWSERRQSATIPLPGRRGTILDRRNRVLAGSQDLPTVFADPRIIEDRAEASRRLSQLLSIPPEKIRERLENPASPGYVALRRGVDAVEDGDTKGLLDAVEQLRKDPIRGIGVTYEPVRTYPMSSLAAHVIGFIGADGAGLEGVELACDKFLKGKAGRRVVFCDASRKALFASPGSFVAPRDGMQVLLTIDSAIQETVERELAKSVQHFQAESGLAVVLNPKTGEILAMACVPTFTPERPGRVPPQIRRNRVLTDPVEPGSIFKPFVMAAGISAGVVKPTDQIHCHNGLYVIGKRMLHDHHPYGTLTAEMVVAKSSNIGMAIVGQRLGNRRMHDFLSQLGFGRKTGFDLPGEGEGLFMPFRNWNSYTTTSVPMGHELAVTPIQVITAFSALVNGGRSIKPYVVAAVVDQDGRIVEDRRPKEPGAQIMDEHAASTIKDILVKVVQEGTGKPCSLDRWQVLGKTGTAQVPRSNRRGYEPDAYLGSFIAAAPASDPQIAALVMIRKPNRRIGYYGGQVSLPVVKAIFEQTLPYLNIPPDKTPQQADSTRLVLDARD